MAASSDGLIIVKAWQDRSNRSNFEIVVSSRSLQAGAMAAQKDKSKRYLRWAAANEGRAASAYNEEIKTLFLQIAAQYRDLAEQIDDPERSRLETRRGVEMLGHLKEHSGAFDPDDIRILVAAFERAWESIQASGAFDTEAKAESARAILAKHIIAAAKDGEYDQGRLRDGALVALAQSNLRSAQ